MLNLIVLRAELGGDLNVVGSDKEQRNFVPNHNESSCLW